VILTNFAMVSLKTEEREKNWEIGKNQKKEGSQEGSIWGIKVPRKKKKFYFNGKSREGEEGNRNSESKNQTGP